MQTDSHKHVPSQGGRGGRKGGFRRPSTFFSSLAPRVFMTDQSQQQQQQGDESDSSVSLASVGGI